MASRKTRRAGWVAVGMLFFAGASAANGQGTGIPPPGTTGSGGTLPRTTTGTTGSTTQGTTQGGLLGGGGLGASAGTGMTTGGLGGGSTGGSAGSQTGGGLGGGGLSALFNVLTPEEESAVLLDTLSTAEMLIEELDLQFDDAMQLFVFVMMVYEAKYLQAVEQVLANGRSGGGNSTPPSGGGTGTGTGAGTGAPTGSSGFGSLGGSGGP